MREVKSCGVLVFSKELDCFLLMKHRNRYDLPKGHINENETEKECALRELEEETGISSSALYLHDSSQYTQTYYPRYKRFGNKKVKKDIVIFLGILLNDEEIRLTEHPAYEWVSWNPPHKIQSKMIDPMLKWFELVIPRIKRIKE